MGWVNCGYITSWDEITVVISRRGINVDFTRDYEYLMG